VFSGPLNDPHKDDSDPGCDKQKCTNVTGLPQAAAARAAGDHLDPVRFSIQMRVQYSATASRLEADGESTLIQSVATI